MKIAARKDLDAHRARAHERIDHYASAERADDTRMALVYALKVGEARTILATHDLPTFNAIYFPLLSAEVGITQDDIVSVASWVMGEHMAWAAKIGAIEAKRLAAKKAVRASNSVDEMVKIADRNAPSEIGG